MELGDQGTKDEGGRSGVDEKELHKRPQADSDDDDEGTRQPYNCTFCRRGFPTAQALGGHMNVHRKDRPGIGASAGPAARTTLMGHGLVSDPAAGSSLLHAEQVPRELRLFGRVVDDGAGAGGRKEHGGACGGRDQYYDVKDSHVGDHGEQKEEELDLELRLGAAGQ